MLFVLQPSARLMIRLPVRINSVRLLSFQSTSPKTSSDGGAQQKDGDGSFSTSKSSTGERSFFAFQKDGSSQFDPLQPPAKPKDFKSQYLRRPLYGYALKGDKSYREVNLWIIRVVVGTFVINLLFFGYFYYQQMYVSTEEERQERYEKTTWARYHSPEAIERRSMMRPFVGRSTLGGFFFYPEHGNTSKEMREKETNIYATWNREDILDRAQILMRTDTGRDELHKKSLADFDEELRK